MSWQNGTVWYANQLDLSHPFTLEFMMNFGSIDVNGADGMVFVLQTVGTNAIGITGAGMGFQGFDPSFGIEFDTFSNPEFSDLTSDHVAFLRDGVIDHTSADNLAGPIQASVSNNNIEDGSDHIVKITWNPQTLLIELYFDCVLRLSENFDLVNSIFGGNTEVFWGFTGATGFYYNAQTVCLQEYFFGESVDTVICAGESIQLAASGNPAGIFSWLPASNIDDASSQTPIVTPSTTTNYCYTYTDLCNENFTDCIEITVEEFPIANAGNDTVYCQGNTVLLNAEIIGEWDNLQWTTSSGNIISGQNSLTPEVSAEGDYILSTETAGAACVATDEVTVVENNLPDVASNDPVQFCPGQSFSLNAGANWDEVIWFDNSSSNTFMSDQQGIFTYTVFINGCYSDGFFEVTETNLPVIDLGPDQEICAGTMAFLDAGVSGVWNTGITSSSLEVSNSGDYSVEVTVSGCTTSDEVTITVVQQTAVNLGQDQVICEGESIEVSIENIGTWSTGAFADSIIISEVGDYFVEVISGPCSAFDGLHVDVIALPEISLGDDILICSGTRVKLGRENDSSGNWLWSNDSTSSMIEIIDVGQYSVIVSNICGSAYDTVEVFIDECDLAIYIPNTFTPDADGVNDVFFVESTGLKSAELMIYNRFGELIFTTIDLNMPWTGNVRQGEYFAPDGVYIYELKYNTAKGESSIMRGHVNLLR